MVTFGDEGRRRGGNGVGVGFSSICNVLFLGKNRVLQRNCGKLLKFVKSQGRFSVLFYMFVVFHTSKCKYSRSRMEHVFNVRICTYYVL